MRAAFLAAALTLGGCGALSGNSVDITSRETAGYPVDRVEKPVDSGPAIHAIGIYEASGDHGHGRHPMADAEVVVEDQGGRPTYLALSSYEPVRWKLSGPGLADVKGVYLAGYNRHEIEGIAGGLVVNLSGNAEPARPGGWADEYEAYEDRTERNTGPARDGPRVSCTYTFWEGSGGGCAAATEFVGHAEERFRATLASFTGTYNAHGFRVNAR